MKQINLLLIFFTLLTISCSAQIKEAEKVDEVANMQCDEYLGRTVIYVDKLKQTPDSKGLVIIYEGKTVKGLYDENSTSYNNEKYVLPRFGLAKELIGTIKTRLKLLGVDEKDITFIKGGFREKLSIEFWIVPNAAKPPKPTPTLNKMRYRKGKPRGYCITI